MNSPTSATPISNCVAVVPACHIHSESPETLRLWVRRVERDRGLRAELDRRFRLGSFDGHNGAWFFSAIVPTTIVYGQPGEDRRASFLGRVRAMYGITGAHAACETRESRAELQAHLDSVGSTGYGRHKRVETGIAP